MTKEQKMELCTLYNTLTEISNVQKVGAFEYLKLGGGIMNIGASTRVSISDIKENETKSITLKFIHYYCVIMVEYNIEEGNLDILIRDKESDYLIMGYVFSGSGIKDLGTDKDMVTAIYIKEYDVIKDSISHMIALITRLSSLAREGIISKPILESYHNLDLSKIE